MDASRSLPALKPRAWAALFAVATLLAFGSTVQAAMALSYGGETVPWIGLLKARLVDWYGCVLFIPVLYWLAAARPLHARTWTRILPLHLLAGLVCALGKEALYVTIGNWFRPGVFHLPEILAGDYLDEVLFFWAVIALIHLYRRPVAAPAEPPVPARDGFVARLGSGGYRLIASADVEWIDAQGNYARLHTGYGSFLVRETMAALSARLEARFVRVHRSAIVDRTRITRIEPGRHGRYRIILASGAEVHAGRSYGHAVRALLG
jgi:hypothetical protein